MIIQCEKCGRKFKIDDSRIMPPGSKVRCSKCGHVSFIEKKDVPDAGDGAVLLTQDPYQTPSFQTPGQTDTEITGEAVEEGETETTDGFTFRYPIRNEADNTPGEDAPGGRSDGYAAAHDAESVPGDGGNWEEFVSISKTERDIDDFRIKGNRDTRRQESDFNWEGLRINDDPVDAAGRTPRMFEDEGTDDDLIIMRDEGIPEGDGLNIGPGEAKPKGREDVRHSPENLSVDMGVLAGSPQTAASYKSGPGPSYRDSFRVHPTRYRSNGGVFTRAAYTLLIMIVFAVIIGASFVILSNTGIIPRESAEDIVKLVRSVIPVSITGSLKNEIAITAHQGKWLDTRNGPMYVVSGTVTNESGRPVNYIKIKSEFVSEGQVVYDNVVYAGNTFSENELRVSPLRDTLLKLKKRSGDIDFYNPEKLAGLNSNIQPGESIPFFTVFPAQGRMLGLKYDLEVAGYE
ncbi:MAG: zinc-ribbon domain-containing protein [Thermodesulfobacteriota bacterium]